MRPKTLSQKTRSTAKVLLAVILIGAFLGCAGIYLYLKHAWSPVPAREDPVIVHIEKGMSSSDIARLLEEKGLIRSAFAFKLYLRLEKEGHRFQAGEYALQPGMTLDEMIRRFNAGDTVKEETIRFTIPEGYTVEQIAESLDEQNIADKEAFLEFMKSPQQLDGKWVKEIPADKELKYVLEGYLFPETYEMKKDSTEKEMIERMLAELDKKLETLPEGWENRLKELGLTFHELMTVASLIEREVVVDKERPIVASVIYNRLNQGMKLQIDATVQYALPEHKERLLYEDLEVDSPYNTYKYAGLPPGPIASPGIESIKAALYPENTNYLFYVTKNDGSQEHYFAETYAEHTENIRRSRMEKQ